MPHPEPNQYEHDYIIGLLQGFRTDLLTDKPVDEIIDFYAVALTAFMRGEVANAVAAMME